jgi:hypothetical protein
MATVNVVIKQQVKDLKRDNNAGEWEPESRVDEGVQRIVKKASVLGVFVSGVALFSDGYNAQISKLFILLF